VIGTSEAEIRAVAATTRPPPERLAGRCHLPARRTFREFRAMTINRRALFVLPVLLAAATAFADDVTTGSGKRISGKLIGVDAQGVTFSSGEAQARIAAKDIVVVDFGNPVAAVPKDKETGKELKSIEVELTDGSVFRCSKFILKEKKVEVDVFPGAKGAAPPAFEIPMATLFSIMRDAGDAKHREAWKKMLAARGKRDLYVIREPNALNFVQGTILGGTADGAEIEFEKEDGAKTTLRQSRAGGYVFAQALPKEVPQMLCKVNDVFGNSLVAQSVEIVASGVTVKTIAGVVVKYASTASLSKLDYSQGNVAYLSDLEARVDAAEVPLDEKGLRLNVAVPYVRDRGLGGDPLKLGAETFAKGLLIAPDTALTYTLNGDYRELKAVAGIPDHTPDANLEAKLTIEADGRAVFSETIKRKDKPKGISLDVKGVKSLRIVVEADLAVNGNRVLLGAALVQK
jgi:NPCBM/NEW2 domain-containing protein